MRFAVCIVLHSINLFTVLILIIFHMFTVFVCSHLTITCHCANSESLVESYFRNPVLPLMIVKVLVQCQHSFCFLSIYSSHSTLLFPHVQASPYRSHQTIIMGDAAHAMVPFYGQGMNAVRTPSFLPSLLPSFLLFFFCHILAATRALRIASSSTKCLTKPTMILV